MTLLVDLPSFATRYVVAPSGCWIWQGASNPRGYGITKAFGRRMNAHRAFYILHVGPIPEGLHIDHLCRRTNCVNPLHLQAVTPRVNKLRGYGFVARKARQTRCVNGHDFTPENTIHVLYRGTTTRRCRTCKSLRDRAYKARTRAS